MSPELPVIYENPRFDAATPTLKPVIDRAVRFGAVMMLEWGTLTLIEEAPRYLKIATVVISILVLAVHESWPWLRMRDKLVSEFDDDAYHNLRGRLRVCFSLGVAQSSRRPTSSAGIGQMPIGSPLPPAQSLIEQPTIEWDGHGPMLFHARFDRSGEKLPIYLDWGNAGNFGQNVFNSGFISNPRVEIGFIERFAVGQSLSATIGSVTTTEGDQQILQWGEPRYDNPKVGITQGGYVARVVIIGKDGKEERYPFLIIPRTPAGSTTKLSPAIVGPQILEASTQ
jgi:hypothetical protein